MKVRIVEIDTCVGKRYKPQTSLFGLLWHDIIVEDYIPQIAKFRTIEDAETFGEKIRRKPVVVKLLNN